MSRCAGDTLPSPSAIGIPEDINAGLAPFNSSSNLQAMETCCHPNVVHQADPDGCVLWCELPESLMNEVQGPSSARPLASVFITCLERAKTSNDTIGFTLTQAASAGPLPHRPPSVLRAGMVVLGVLGAVQLWN